MVKFFTQRWQAIVLWWTQPALAPVEWHRSKDLLKAHFAKQIAIPEVAAAFDSDFTKSLVTRRTEKQSLLNRVQLFNLSLLAFMGAWFFFDDLSFSLFGLSVRRADQLVEIVKVIASASGFYFLMVMLENRVSLIVLDVLTERRIGGEAWRYGRLAHATAPGEGLVDFAPRPSEHHVPIPFVRRLVQAWYAIALFAFAIFIVTTLAINIAVLWSMIVHPAVGPITSRVLAAASLVFDIASWGMMALAFAPLPLRNYRDINELAPILEKYGPEVWWPEMKKRLDARKAAAGKPLADSASRASSS